MIKGDRPAAGPATLLGAQATAEAAAAEAYYDTWKPGDPSFGDYKHYGGYDVVEALWELFHHKCAYCEGPIEKGTSQVEHYRPKGGVEGTDHPGYWWLAHAWTNLLPTCPACNTALRQHLITADMTLDQVEAMQAKAPQSSYGKANHFPVGGTRLVAKEDDHDGEDPHIIDPTRRDPAKDLEWRHAGPYSVLAAAATGGTQSVHGSETIRCLALNRLGLVVARTKELDTLKAQWISIQRDLARATNDPANMALHIGYARQRVEDLREACHPEKHYSAMATAFVEFVRAELQAWIEANTSKAA